MNLLMHEAFNWKHAAQFMGVFLVVTIAGLWAMNTLSALFAGPVAEYKHVVAGLIILLTIRWTLTGKR